MLNTFCYNIVILKAPRSIIANTTHLSKYQTIQIFDRRKFRQINFGETIQIQQAMHTEKLKNETKAFANVISTNFLSQVQSPKF